MAAPDKPKNEKTYILNATCKATKGIVAAVTSYLAENDCYICSLEQFDDESTERFFMRAVFKPEVAAPKLEELKHGFVEIAERLGMSWNFFDPSQIGRASCRERVL